MTSSTGTNRGSRASRCRRRHRRRRRRRRPHPRPRPMSRARRCRATRAGASTPSITGDSAFRMVMRGVLVVPKLVVVDGVLSPMYGVVWAQDHYDLENLDHRVFYNDDRTIGIFPTANYVTGLGADAGVRFDDSNLLGEHEHLALQATTGAAFGDFYRVGGLIPFRNRRSHQSPTSGSGSTRTSSPADRSVRWHRQRRPRAHAGVGDRSAHEPHRGRDVLPLPGGARRAGRGCAPGVRAALPRDGLAHAAAVRAEHEQPVDQ